jgi:hypothetical protein
VDVQRHKDEEDKNRYQEAECRPGDRRTAPVVVRVFARDEEIG